MSRMPLVMPGRPQLRPMYGGAIPDTATASASAVLRSLAIELAPLNVAVNAGTPDFLYSEA
ncbi:hypothetical protein AB4Y37_02975 [Paraburkholderia caribensis]